MSKGWTHPVDVQRCDLSFSFLRPLYCGIICVPEGGPCHLERSQQPIGARLGF